MQRAAPTWSAKRTSGTKEPIGDRGRREVTRREVIRRYRLGRRRKRTGRATLVTRPPSCGPPSPPFGAPKRIVRTTLAPRPPSCGPPPPPRRGAEADREGDPRGEAPCRGPPPPPREGPKRTVRATLATSTPLAVSLHRLGRSSKRAVRALSPKLPVPRPPVGPG